MDESDKENTLEPADDSEPSSEGNEQEQEYPENLSSESMSTVLASEYSGQETENPQNNDQDSEEIDQNELDKEVEKELEKGVEAINKYLEEEAEFINAYQEMLGSFEAEQLYERMTEEEANSNDKSSENSEELENKEVGEQEKEIPEPNAVGESTGQMETDSELGEEFNEVEQHQVEPLIEEALETEPEPIVNEEEIEKLQELELGEQFEHIHLNEYIEELVEKQEEEKQELEKEIEEKEKEEVLANELKETEIDREFREEVNEVEQHQIEPLIEEALETEIKPIINEEEFEKLQELELEEQFQEVHLNEQIEDIVEGLDEELEREQEEEVEVQTDSSKGIDLDLDEELELNLVEQHQVEPFIEEAFEDGVEETTSDEEIERLQEMELEEQFETVHEKEYLEELEEYQEELNHESEKTEQENENVEQTQEEEQNSKYLIEQLEEQEWNLELDYEEEEQLEQHQVEEAIEEELETEAEPIIEEEKLEHIKNLEPEKQLETELFYELIEDLLEKQSEEKEELETLTKEEKVANGIEKLREREDDVDPQQELEEILEQNRKIEQNALIEIEQEEEVNSEKTAAEKYESAKKLYREQTGKRPIYANNETKGFKKWLEELKNSVGKEKEEQKKEETWKWTLKNWILRALEIDPMLRSELLKLVEEFDELEKLVEKYSQLYGKAQREKLSQSEKNELKSLIKTLQKIENTIELFLGIREIKRYIDQQYYYDFWDKPYVKRVRHHFFSRLSQRYNLLKKTQNNEKIEETIRNWIENASKSKIKPKVKAILRKTAENYNQMDALSTRFMELYRKNQNKQISKNENGELMLLIKTLQNLDPVLIETFTKMRAFKRYLKNQNNNSIKWLDSPQVYQYFATSKPTSNKSSHFFSFTPLTSKQIIIREQKYQKMLEELCVKYAEDFKNIILKEYGENIMEMKIPLSSHFGFRLDGYIRKVTNTKRDRAIGIDILERVKKHIMREYSKWDQDWWKESSFKRVIAFIDEYKEFSQYVSGKSGQGTFSISNIKYEQDPEKLAPKSWLFENLRHLLPKKYGLPIPDNLLTWYIFGDTPSHGRVSKLKWTTEGKELSKRMYLSELLAFDYKINTLNEKALSEKGLEISKKDLETLKKRVSFLAYYYVFGGYHESTYVSKTTTKKIEVGKNFFTIEYNIIRAIFFAAAEANRGVPLNFEEIQRASGMGDLKHHLFEGFGFTDDLHKLLSYFKDLSENRPSDSNSQIFQDTKEVLDGYFEAYKAKYSEFQKTREHATKFQGRVYLYSQNFLALEFASEVKVRAVMKEKYISTINQIGVNEKIYVHGSFSFDGYLDLSRALKNFIGLNDKWIGLAIEANGTYYHTLPHKIEADRKKRLMCKEKNIILIEIWEDMTSNTWGNEILAQIKMQTGTEINRNKLGELKKYLDKKQK